MKTLLLISLALLLNSCGASPLWNHKVEKNGFNGIELETHSDGLKFAKQKFSFSLSWVIGPVIGENKLLIKSWNDKTGSLNGPYQDLPQTFHVHLWMPEMGHGSAPVSIKKIDDGEYEVSNVYIIMGGTWQLFFQLLKDNVVVDENIVPITL